MNAQNHEHERTKFEHEHSKVCWTHKRLDMNLQKTDPQEDKGLLNPENFWPEHTKSVYGSTKLWTLTQNSMAKAPKASHARRKVWWMHGSITMNAHCPNMIRQTSGLDCTKFGTWTFEILIINARESGERKLVWRRPGKLEKHAKKSDESTEVWTPRHDRLKMKIQKSGENKKVWQWTHVCLDMSARTIELECTKFRLWTPKILNMNARKFGELTRERTWAHENIASAWKSVDPTVVGKWRYERLKTNVQLSV